MDVTLQKIKDKITAGERISDADALALYAPNELIALGEIADLVREKKNGKRVFFNINRHLNYSNVCYVDCKFCEFGQPKNSSKAYELSLEEMKKTAVKAQEDGATELHIVGGLHPEFKFEYYETLLRELKRAAPKLHLKAFTAVEIDYFAKISRQSIEQSLERLRSAGLDSMPGGGAEILGERVRKQICPNKIDGERWLQIHRIAHGMGIRSNATMLYGHVENDEDRVDHLR